MRTWKIGGTAFGCYPARWLKSLETILDSNYIFSPLVQAGICILRKSEAVVCYQSVDEGAVLEAYRWFALPDLIGGSSIFVLQVK